MRENPEWDNPRPWVRNEELQTALYQSLRHFIDVQGYVPSCLDLARLHGIKTHRLVMYHLERLEEQGLIRINKGNQKQYVEVLDYMPLDRLDRVRKYARACRGMMLVEGRYPTDSQQYKTAAYIYKEATSQLREGDI